MPLPLTAYKDPLPILDPFPPLHIDADGTPFYRIVLRAGAQQVHSELPQKTPFWGYEGKYPGPMIATPKSTKVVVEFVNQLPLPDPSNFRSQWPFSIPPDLPNVPMHVFVPPKPWTVVHLHGSPSPADMDGWTDNAYFPGGSAIHCYPPQIEAALLWYHYHANMVTRLNVYAGLAGLYLVRDLPLESAHQLPVGKPFEIPLLLQDRKLEVNYAEDKYTGRFAYQPLNASGSFPQAEHVVVNGTIWPYHRVNPDVYRLRLLNGSNSRFFRLAVQTEGQAPGTQLLTQIGVDGGFLQTWVKGPTTRPVQDGADPEEVLTLAPAERADVLIDFKGFAPGTNVDLIDSIPFSEPAPVLRFVVEAGAAPRTLTLPLAFPRSRRLPAPITPSAAPEVVGSPPPSRVIGLLPKVLSPQALMLTINDRAFHDTVEEIPEFETEEIWEFVNVTGEEHPMHLHLVNFEVLDRQGFEIFDLDPKYTEKAAKYFRCWAAIPSGIRPPLPPGLRFTSKPIPRDANEVAPKDTVRVPAFTLTRIHVAFKYRTGMYMYHCHILEHEDMEMMRPLLVVPKGMHAGLSHNGHGNGHNHGHGH